MSVAEANKIYFDALGGIYDEIPWFARAQEKLTHAIRTRLDWLAVPLKTYTAPPHELQEVRQLDYACGTGLMTRALGPYVTSTRGIDISSTMVSKYNERALSAGIPETTISAIQGNLFSTHIDPQFSSPQFFNYDIVTVGFAFHHFDNPVSCARKLGERLKPGGLLLISDMLEDGDIPISDDDEEAKVEEVRVGRTVAAGHHDHSEMHSHGHSHSHSHSHAQDPVLAHVDKLEPSLVVHGFSVAGIKAIFEEAGLVDIDIVVLDQEGEKLWTSFGEKKMWKTPFLAMARRPVEEGKREL